MQPKPIIRNNPAVTYDPANIENLIFNPAAGAKKSTEVGRHLLPIPIISAGAVAYTTVVNAAAVALPGKGKNLAVYNSSNAVGSVTLGEDNTITSLAAGATDANGHVGIPCPPNAWTYIACSTQNWVISSAATLLVFLIDDQTTVKSE
jgi:hypothetical protein